MNTPITPLPGNAYADFSPEERAPARGADPDDPPWGVPAAAFVWLSSLLLMVFVPLAAIIPYTFMRYSGADFRRLDELLLGDPNILLITLLATLPAHLVTLGIIWAVATGLGKRPFWGTIGWGWAPGFGFWKSVLAAVALLGAAIGVAYLLGVQKTPFDEMLESSAGARFATAFLATATAPLVEELVYRGVVYPALQRVLGVIWAVVVVGGLFALVHVSQYKTSPGTIGAIVLLSYALTVIRARTGRVLPCFVIHLIYHALQVAGLIAEYFQPGGQPAGGAQQQQAALSALASHALGLAL